MGRCLLRYSFERDLDAYIAGNHFSRNTAALYLEGASRMLIEKNSFEGNGWAMRIQASCMDNTIQNNNFIENTLI